MERQSLLSKLKDYTDRFPEERLTTDRLIDFVVQNDRCFMTSFEPGHVTGSAWIVDSHRKHTLLTHHKKLDMWVQLGGHADGESDILSVAFREAKEESGLTNIVPVSESIFDIDIHLIPKNPVMPEHYHYDVRFLFEADMNEKVAVSDESHDVAWFSVDDLQQVTDEESVLRMGRKTRGITN